MQHGVKKDTGTSHEHVLDKCCLSPLFPMQPGAVAIMPPVAFQPSSSTFYSNRTAPHTRFRYFPVAIYSVVAIIHDVNLSFIEVAVAATSQMSKDQRC